MAVCLLSCIDIAVICSIFETVAQSRRDTQSELTDFTRTRTELECIIDDLRAAGQNVGGKHEDYEAELKQVEEKADQESHLKEGALESNISNARTISWRLLIYSSTFGARRTYVSCEHKS